MSEAKLNKRQDEVAVLNQKVSNISLNESEGMEEDGESLVSEIAELKDVIKKKDKEIKELEEIVVGMDKDEEGSEDKEQSKTMKKL